MMRLVLTPFPVYTGAQGAHIGGLSATDNEQALYLLQQKESEIQVGQCAFRLNALLSSFLVCSPRHGISSRQAMRDYTEQLKQRLDSVSAVQQIQPPSSVADATASRELSTNDEYKQAPL